MIASRHVFVLMIALAMWLGGCTLSDSADEVASDASSDTSSSGSLGGSFGGGFGGGLGTGGMVADTSMDTSSDITGGQAGTGGTTTGGTTGGSEGGLPVEVTDYLDLPEDPYDYDDPLPSHFQSATVVSQDNTPSFNPLTNEGATLGRVLFYDTQLSSNGTISCASCHGQATGFSDTNTFSEGFEGGLTGRNSMGLSNSRFYAGVKFFWDERADTLEDQVLMPIQDPVEMGLTIEQLVERVETQPYYAYLFTEAFGDAEVTEERISFALAQFVRSIVSYRSRFDAGLAMANDIQSDFGNFTAEENRGKELFLSPQTGLSLIHISEPTRPY